jgi:hypothetical protein
MSNRIDEQELLRRMADLPREIQPRSDPWSAISARLEPRAIGRVADSRRRSWALRAVAATVVLGVTAGILLGPRLSDPLEPVPATSVAQSQPDVSRQVDRLPAALVASEVEYQAAFREFIAVGQARSNLSAQTIASIETGWADLREAESALAAALAVNPDDRFLNKRMLELRARQLGFLQQLASLDQSNRRLMI